MLRSTRAPSALHPTWAWILGLAAGFIGTWIAILAPIPGVAIYALVAIGLVLRGPRAAFGGAMLFMTGLWFAYFHGSMLARCAAANTSSGSCMVIDANGTLIPALTLLLAGTALAVYALFFGKRSLRGGE
jgi:hypothetical protein